MPWDVRRSGCPESKPWATIKESTGEVVGCHETRDDAEAQMRALYASEKNK